MSQTKSLFKVYFEGFNEEYNPDLHLTFISIQDLNLMYSTFPAFIQKFNNVCRKKGNQGLKNISQVISHGTASTKDMLEYHVLLFSKEEEGKTVKNGYLLGKNKQNEYNILGLWPYHQEDRIRAKPSLIKLEIEEICESPDQFSELLLVN